VLTIFQFRSEFQEGIEGCDEYQEFEGSVTPGMGTLSRGGYGVLSGGVNHVQYRYSVFTDMHDGDVWQAVKDVFFGARHAAWAAPVWKQFE
jgi:hypothetical protein